MNKALITPSSLENMRTAVIYDSLMGKGGSERATLVLARAFNADIWTTTYLPEKAYPDFELFKVYDNPLRCLKFNWHLGPLDLILRGLIQTESIFRFRRMEFSDYDLVITIGQYSKHVPIHYQNHRMHYELYVKTSYQLEWLFKAWVWYMKKIDYEVTQKIPTLVCNSENTKNKIQKIYNRDAEVVYPAVNINMFRTGNSEDYFLAVERIVPEKGIETQLEAFRIVPERKLLIVGSPNEKDIPYFRKLVRIAPRNVTFVGSGTNDELVKLYAHSKAVIQTNPDEALGRVPIEAMASGKPCIAVNAGGFKETLVNGKTGVLVDPPYSQNIAEAIRNFNRLDYNPDDCQERAKLFSEETHIKKMRKIVANL